MCLTGDIFPVKIFDKTALTFDDLSLVPAYSEVLPSQAELCSRFSRNISLNIPIVSSAMDTVTEFETAIVLAQEGGVGVIHKNLSVEEQCLEVGKVKKYESGMIFNPITVHPEEPLSNVMKIIEKHKISGVPVVDHQEHLVGIVTSRDLRFETRFDQKVENVMTKGQLVTAPEGITLEEAKAILQKHRIEKLPVVNKDFQLRGLITFKDMEKSINYPHSNKDSLGRLRVAAAVGIGVGELLRAQALVESGVDALVVDTAHGHSAGVLEMLKELKELKGICSEVDVVVGNVATEQGCRALIERGVDGVKVGIGPGSICTTRVVAGVGIPQAQAVLDCHRLCREEGVPMISDGGIKYSGDIVKALALGASSVMIGSLFAGTNEAPGEMVLYQGRSYKVYRGMGSVGAMAKGSRDRYAQEGVQDREKTCSRGY